MIKKILNIIFLFLVIITSYAQNIEEVMPNIKKISAFISCKNGTGTCFFLKFNKVVGKSDTNYFIVTAKHIIQDSIKKNCDTIEIFANSKTGRVGIEKIPLFVNGVKQNVFFHSDSSVDIAIIQYKKMSSYDIEYLDQSHVVSRPGFTNPSIIEGAETFFIGWFKNFYGTKKIQPIVRFGRICLIPEERILTLNGLSEVIIIESASFGGNSGSPLYFKNIWGGQQGSFTLGGIVSGTFTDDIYIKNKEGSLVPNENVRFNNGVSYIVPAYLLYELIVGENKIQ